jgi:hypothetical protein
VDSAEICCYRDPMLAKRVLVAGSGSPVAWVLSVCEIYLGLGRPAIAWAIRSRKSNGEENSGAFDVS